MVSQPSAPDPYATAAAQNQQNQSASQYNSVSSNANEINPYGTVSYQAVEQVPVYTNGMRNTGQYSEAANSTLKDHFNNLMSLTRQGASFNQLHELRSLIAEQARGPDPSTRRAAGQILGEIDRLTTKTAPDINPNKVDIGSIYPEATRLWRASSLADDAGWIADKTARKASWRTALQQR